MEKERINIEIRSEVIGLVVTRDLRNVNTNDNNHLGKKVKQNQLQIKWLYFALPNVSLILIVCNNLPKCIPVLLQVSDSLIANKIKIR